MDRGRERIVELAGWIAIAVTGMVLLTQAVGWDPTTLVAVLQAVTPISLVMVFAIVVVASVARAWWLAGTASLVLFGTLALAAPLVFTGSQPVAATDSEGLSIAAVNLLFDNPIVEQLADDLEERAPDVIAFSEYTTAHRRILGGHPLADRYPHRIDLDESFGSGMALWSRYPIVRRGPDVGARRGIDVTLDGPDGSIRVVAVHPKTPISDFDAWKSTLRTIGDSASGSPTPTVVVGDFNASYWHPAFRDLLDRGLTDAHIAAGRGWSTSWPTDSVVPAFVRLDHALTDDQLAVTDLVDFEPPGSDHRAFVVTVSPVDVSPGG